MNDTSESKDQSDNPAGQGEQNRKPKSSQPSFEEIMAAVDAPPAPAPKAPPSAPPKVAQKPQANVQPSFEDIMAGVSQPPPVSPPPAHAKNDSGERKGGRGPRKDERKWPVVVRKITLPKLGETVRLDKVTPAQPAPKASPRRATGTT